MEPQLWLNIPFAVIQLALRMLQTKCYIAMAPFSSAKMQVKRCPARLIWWRTLQGKR